MGFFAERGQTDFGEFVPILILCPSVVCVRETETEMCDMCMFMFSVHYLVHQLSGCVLAGIK